jgi:hypothetical protein
VVLAVTGNLAAVPFAGLMREFVPRQITAGRELRDLPAAANSVNANGWFARLWRSFVGT